jgi:hypothetical protein
MSTATLTRKTDMSDRKLESILAAHRIPAREWPEWRGLVFYGIRPSFASRVRRGNRGGAFNSILIELTKKCKFRFPPPNWKTAARAA